MSDPGQPGDNPFGGIPFLGDLARMLQGQGPVNWEAARQIAYGVAAEGDRAGNVEPAERFRVQELARLAELHVQGATGLSLLVDGRPVEVVPVTRSVWVARTLDAYRPLFDRLAGSLGAASAAEAVMPVDDADDESGAAELAMLGQLMKMVAPTMLGMSIGSMVGHLAGRSLGQYDLPIPRPGQREVLVLPATVTSFATDWSLPPDEVLLWVCLHELATQAVLGVPHVRDTLQALLQEHAGGFRPDPRSLAERMGEIGGTESSDPLGQLGELQRLLSDPEVLLGAVRSPAQEALQPRLDAVVAVVVGVVDHVVDTTAATITSSGTRIAEAVRRRRAELGQADRMIEQLLGLSLAREQVAHGGAFVSGVLDREGETGLARLWDRAEALPTPAEVDAPGLWLARLELDGS